MGEYPQRIRWSKEDDDKAWAEMARKQREEQNRKDADYARKKAEAAALASNVNSGFELGAAIDGATGEKGGLARATKVTKAVGGVGKVLTTASAVANYDADRRTGRSRMGATLNAAKGLAKDLGVAEVGAKLGALAGGEFGPPGALIGGVVGGIAAPVVAPVFRAVRNHITSDPYWQDVARKASDPLYFARSRGYGR